MSLGVFEATQQHWRFDAQVCVSGERDGALFVRKGL